MHTDCVAEQRHNIIVFVWLGRTHGRAPFDASFRGLILRKQNISLACVPERGIHVPWIGFDPGNLRSSADGHPNSATSSIGSKTLVGPSSSYLVATRRVIASEVACGLNAGVPVSKQQSEPVLPVGSKRNKCTLVSGVLEIR